MAATEFGPFPINRASTLCGISRSMLDYLCRSEVFVPSYPGHRGRGRRRLYTFGDIVLLRTLAQLLERGVSVARLKNAFRLLRSEEPEISPTTPHARYLVTDGKNVYFLNHGSLEELTPRRQMSFAFVVKLEQVRIGLTSDLKKAAKRRAA